MTRGPEATRATTPARRRSARGRTTTGGTADPSQSDAELLAGGPNAPKGAFYWNRNNVANPGTACTVGTCTLGVNGAILGPNAENVLVAVHFFTAAGGAPKSVSGILAFKK